MTGKNTELANEIYNFVMSYYDPELGMNYLALKPALQRYVKVKRIKKT